jgi:hypothetical protein
MSLLHKILVALALLAVAFVIGRRTAPMPVITGERVQLDTLVIRDTITQEMPVYRTKWMRDTITLFVHDTIPVYLPREVRIYEDSTYRAEVSGVFPSLDRIDIYQQEKTITIQVEKQVAVPVRQRWGIGLQAGYGAHISGSSVALSPYIGIGITYNFISW